MYYAATFFQKNESLQQKFDLLNVRKCSKKQCYKIKKIFFEINNSVILKIDLFNDIEHEIFIKKRFRIFIYIFRIYYVHL